MNFEDRVKLYEYKLNDTDDQIIDYIRANKKEVMTISIQKLSQKLFTVPNTIVRLSRKLGYEGFSELKLALKTEQETNSIPNTELPDSIKKTYQVMDMNTIDKVCKKFQEAKNIYFYGIGDSVSFCEMMAKNLRCVGKKTEFFTHRHDLIYNAENIKPKDVVFVISVTGETNQIIEATNIAKERGAYIISITHFCKNSLVNLADISLYCWACKQKLNNYDITDRIGIMIVLRKLSEHFWKFYC